MKLPSKLPTTLRYMLITFGILLVSLGYYWYYYIPSKDAYFTSRNLRLLSDMSEGITKVVETYKGQLDKNFINNKKPLTQLIQAQHQNSLSDNQEKQIKSIVKSQVQRIRYLKYDDSKITIAPKLDSEYSESDYITKPSKVNYTLNLKEAGYVLQMKYQGTMTPEAPTRRGRRTRPYLLDLETHAPLKSIMDPIIGGDIFDNILLIEHEKDPDKNGRVIYQAQQEEFQVIRLDSLTDNLKNTWSSWHEDVVWGNTNYKIYVQPVRIALLGQQENNETAVKEWMLVGLVDAGKFNAATRKISRFYLSQYAFLFFLILFSIPLIKLSYLGEREELRRFDLIMTIFSIFALAGLLTFWLLSVILDTQNIEEVDRGALNGLAEEMETNFYEELDLMIAQFGELQEKFNNEIDEINTRIKQNNRTDTISPSNFVLPGVYDPNRLIFTEEEVKNMPYPYFTQFAWLNESGLQTRKIGPRVDITPLVSVGHRDYFKRIVNQATWTTEGGDEFFIDPIISFTTGEFIAMVSMFDPVSDEPVNAMSTKFISLNNPVLPEGYGYCIINEKGEVLFHNESEKNMQENFFVECNGAPNLRAAVYSRTEKYLNVNYLGHEHRIHSKPFKNIPEWTLITYVDLSEIRSSQLTALSSAVVLYALLLLIFLAILLYFLNFGYFRALDRFWPKQENDNTYQLYSIVLFGLIGLLYYIIFNFSTAFTLLSIFAFPIIASLSTRVFFNRQSWLDESNLLSSTIFKITGLNDPNIPNNAALRRKKIRALRLATLSASTFFMIVCYLLGWNVFLYGAIGISIGLLLNYDPITEWVSTKRFPNYYARFALCGIAFFMLSSVLPTIAFFKIGYDAEKEIAIRKGQLSLYDGLVERESKTEDLLSDIVFSKEARAIRASNRLNLSDPIDIYSEFFYNTMLNTDADNNVYFEVDPIFQLGVKPKEEYVSSLMTNPDPQQVKADIPQSSSTNTIDHILGFFRAALNIVNYENWELYNDQVEHQGWGWKRWLTNTRNYLYFKVDRAINLDDLYLFSNFRPFTEPKVLFWFIGLIGILVLLYALMLFFIYKTFGINLILPKAENAGSAALVTVNQNTIYIGQPNSGKTRALRNLKDTKRHIGLRYLSKPEALEKEILRLEHPENDYKVFVLDQFGLYVDNEKWSKAILELLEQLIGTHNKKVVLVTTIDPTMIIDRLSKRTIFTQTGPDNKETKQEVIIDTSTYNRWTLLLSSFTKLYHRITVDQIQFKQEIRQKYEEKGQVEDIHHPLVKLLIEECKQSPFLHQVGLGMATSFDIPNDFMNEEALINEILLRAEAYYQSIWSSATIDEKVTLIHLARNNFVPYKDAKIVRLLIRKGLVGSKDYKLFNKSFSDFAISKETSASIINWRKTQKSSWDNIRTPLITFVLAVVAFLIITQRQLFNVSIAWITTIAALLPAIFRILAVVRPDKAAKAGPPLPPAGQVAIREVGD